MIDANFSDDHIDQIVMEFFSDLMLKFRPRRISDEDNPFKDPNLSFNPNLELDKNTKILIERHRRGTIHMGSVDDHGNYTETKTSYEIPFDEFPSNFPKNFWERVRRWIIMHLNVLFFREFYCHRTKFTPESFEKLVDIGTKIMISTTYPFDDPNHQNFWIEMTISYMEGEAVKVTEKVDFNLLKLAIFFDISMIAYQKDDHYHNLVYWLDPSKYINIEDVGDDAFFLNFLPKILKQNPVPENTFTNDIINGVKYLILQSKKYKVEWVDTVTQLFLHFAYYGFVKGKIPGIESGGYSIRQLRNDLKLLF